jgi:hypothetical protein
VSGYTNHGEKGGEGVWKRCGRETRDKQSAVTEVECVQRHLISVPLMVDRDRIGCAALEHNDRRVFHVQSEGTNEA